MNCLSSSFFAILTILLLVSASAKKKDRNLPQGHFGILKGYEPGAFDLALKSSDEKDLNNGKSVMKQSLPKKGEDDGGGGAICVQDIQAPKDAVWRQILLLDEYEKKVAKVMECKNYEVKNRGDGTFNIKTRMKLGVMPGYSVSSFDSSHSLTTFDLANTFKSTSSTRTTMIMSTTKILIPSLGAWTTTRRLISTTFLVIGI